MRYSAYPLFIAAAFILSLLSACAGAPGNAEEQSEQTPALFPDYTFVTIPPNIAPLNFQTEKANRIKAEIYDSDNRLQLSIHGKRAIDIPLNKWRKLLETNKGKSLNIRLSEWNDEHPKGISYQPFSITISDDEIDPWIVYRLIDPAYVNWSEMGIYQRELSSFSEKAIVTNHDNKRQCMNCHTPHQNSPNTYVYHVRGENGGTNIVKDGQQHFVQLNLLGKKQQGVYPSWHPGGRYIAFSSNSTHQSFLHSGRKALEVYDSESDLILYDTQQQQILTDDRFNSPEHWETFPTWSPDGKHLYFCTAQPEADMPARFKQVKYALVRVPFNEQEAAFGEKVDTLYQPFTRGGSASHPRISPDGRFLLYTEASSGTFPIWHAEADLKLIDLAGGKELDTRILNSREADSYHSWSSNGRWILFTSRRMDGRHTRLYIAHIDAEGAIGKPFMMPQKNPTDNHLRIQSFNCPEFMTGEVIKH